MSVISAAAMRCRTMADGSLRIEIEIEPKDRQAAFSMFGEPGTPMALAALKVGHAAAGTEPVGDEPGQEPKGGALSKLAGQWCDMPAFQEWMREKFLFLWGKCEIDLIERNGTANEGEVAAEVIRRHCGVTSRALLDHDRRAGEQFHAAIRFPFSEELRRRAPA